MAKKKDPRMRTRAAFNKYYETIESIAINEALDSPRPRELSAPGKSNIANNKRRLRHLQEVLEREGVEWIGHMEQDHVITAYRECVESMIPRVGEKPMKSTVRGVRSSFKAFIEFHTKRGAISALDVPLLVDHLPKPAIKPRKMLIIPGADWPDIFRIAHKRHIMDRVLIELCFYLGMRASEARLARWSDLIDHDDEGNIKFFRHKLNDEHQLPVVTELQETLKELRQWLEDQGMPPEPDWPIVLARRQHVAGRGRTIHPDWKCQPGKAMAPDPANKGIKTVLLEFGIKPKDMKCQGFHIARRSRACQLLRLGVDIAIISRMLGHDDYKNTLTYIRDAMGDEDLREALNKPLVPTKEMELYNEPGFGVVPDALPAVLVDREAMAKNALDMYIAGLLNKDEFQAMMLRLVTNN